MQDLLTKYAHYYQLRAQERLNQPLFDWNIIDFRFVHFYHIHFQDIIKWQQLWFFLHFRLFFQTPSIFQEQLLQYSLFLLIQLFSLQFFRKVQSYFIFLQFNQANSYLKWSFFIHLPIYYEHYFNGLPEDWSLKLEADDSLSLSIQ